MTNNNANSADSFVFLLQAVAPLLPIAKSVHLERAPCHGGFSGNKLSDHKSILGATETQTDNAHETATRPPLLPTPSHLTRAAEGGRFLCSRSTSALPG